MKHHPVSIRLALILVFATSTARAQEALAPETARRLKDATVYVKVAIGPLALSGSGFVIESTGDSALIVTNQHVVVKPKVLAPGGFIPGLRGRDRLALSMIQRTLAANEPVISAVLNSGEPNEQVVKAEVLCQVEDPDLAVLKVTGLKGAPKPIEFRQTTPLSETMPVLILGFPFGDTLATNKGNPNITIGKGSVSSIHRDKSGKVTKVQIDGAINPGNSGGPVVDAKGNLIGISVQAIQGSNIGMAIPAGEVHAMLDGSLGRPSIAATPSVNGAPPKYEILVPVIDPMKKLKSATVQYVLKPIPADASRSGQFQLSSDAALKKLDLAPKGGIARVDLSLDPKAAPTIKQVTVQASYVNGEGKTVYLNPQVVTIPAAVQVTRAAGGTTTTTRTEGGTTTTTTTKTEGGVTTTTTETVGPDGRTSRRQTTSTRGGSSGNPPATSGAGKGLALKVGDKAMVTWAGKAVTAEVVGFAATGWVKVKFPFNGIELTPTLPPDQVKLIAEKKKSPPAGATLRTWASKGNKFTIKAKFVELKDDSLTLEKEDGEAVTLSLDKLTEADQKAARQLADESEENPFATKPR